MGLESHLDGARALLRVSGDVDAATAPLLRGCVDDALDHGCRQVDVDLTDVQFLDCSGVGVLHEVHDVVAAAGGTLTCLCPEGQPRALMHLVGAGSWLSLGRARAGTAAAKPS